MITLDKLAPALFLLMWSSGAIFAKLGLEDSSVSVFLAIRSTGAAFALFAMCIILKRSKYALGNILFPAPLIFKALGLGLILQVGYQSSYFLALDHHLTPGVLAIILGLQPIITPLIAREKTGISSLAFLFLGLVGLILAVMGAKEMGAITPTGLLFGLISVMAISLGAVLQKRTTIDPVASAFYQSLGASIVFLAILPATDTHLTLTPTFLMSASWMIFVVSTLALLLLFYMLSKNPASKVSVLFYLVPVITIALDYVIFGNKISAITALGAALIIASLMGFNHAQSKCPVLKSPG